MTWAEGWQTLQTQLTTYPPPSLLPSLLKKMEPLCHCTERSDLKVISYYQLQVPKKHSSDETSEQQKKILTPSWVNLIREIFIKVYLYLNFYDCAIQCEVRCKKLFRRFLGTFLIAFLKRVLFKLARDWKTTFSKHQNFGKLGEILIVYFSMVRTVFVLPKVLLLFEISSNSYHLLHFHWQHSK